MGVRLLSLLDIKKLPLRQSRTIIDRPNDITYPGRELGLVNDQVHWNTAAF